jgi:hypothetical protein
MLYTTKDLANYFKVTIRTITRHLKKLGFEKLGHDYVMDRIDFVKMKKKLKKTLQMLSSSSKKSEKK